MKKIMAKVVCLCLFLVVFQNSAHAQGVYKNQPNLDARAVDVLNFDGLQFKDLNKNDKLDVYEDWRQPVEKRVADLVSQMTLQEKAGMLLINTLNSGKGGTLPDQAVRYIQDEKMSRFVFRNTVTATPAAPTGSFMRGIQITPYQAAQFMNSIQELAESTRLGIPALFKSNARNHYDHNAQAGISVPAGSFSEWPKEAGLAATRDMELIKDFAQTMAREWTSIGLRGMYGYMADIATEPRWYRVHETFTEDADLCAEIMTILVKNIQGEQLNSKSVALTMKHFPGGGPQEGGGDPHYDFGKNQIYPTDNFDYHLKPFVAAIDAGVSSIMPYYGIPIGQKYIPNNVGMSFSKGIVTDLLRKKLGFKGNVNSDTGIITRTAWGVEDLTVDERIVMAVNAGTDVLSGFDDNKQILNLVTKGKISQERLNLSATRLLTEQFQLGLFENPYVDSDRAAYVVGNRAFQKKAEAAQRKSIVLLQNKDILPIQKPTPPPPERRFPAGFGLQQDKTKEKTKPVKVKLYTMGMNSSVVGDRQWNAYTVVSGDYDAKKGETRPVVPEGIDYAMIRINVTNDRSGGRFFGGPSPEELDILTFTDMAQSKTWKISPSLEDIQAVMNEVGAEKTILSIWFRQPYVMDKSSGLQDAGAILATFGVSDAAIMDILTGKINPTGKLPFALANSAKAIVKQATDAPGYKKENTLFPFGHGLSY